MVGTTTASCFLNRLIIIYFHSNIVIVLYNASSGDEKNRIIACRSRLNRVAAATPQTFYIFINVCELNVNRANE